MSFFGGFFQTPGVNQVFSTIENQFWFGPRQMQREVPVVIDSAAVDAGNTPTTLLRPGLIMGMITATQKVKAWDPTAVDGSQFIYGLLLVDQSMLTNATAADRYHGMLIVAGAVKAANVLIPGEAAIGLSGKALEYMVRAALTANGRFIIDDELQGSTLEWAAMRTMAATTLTVTAAMNNTLFLCAHSSLTAFTLPAVKQGLRYGFLCMHDSGISVEGAAADLLITYHDLAATRVTISTTGKVIGSFIEALCVGTKWAILNRMTGSGTNFTNVTVTA